MVDNLTNTFIAGWWQK